MSTETIYLLIPEMLLAAVAVVIYVGGAFTGARSLWNGLALLGILGAAVALALGPTGVAAGGSLAVDSLAYYARWLTLAAGLFFVLLASRPLAGDSAPEYMGSLLLALDGVMLVAGAGDLVLLFVGLELISIPTYILLYLGRRDAASEEATAKYFFLSILASALLLYGLSFLYGAAGSVEIPVIAQRLAELAQMDSGFSSLGAVGLVLIFAGLGFKIAAVPFHFYAPDVYEGTTNINAGLLSVIPKAAGFVALVRLLVVAMPALEPYTWYGWRIALTLAVLTMTIGNVIALWQDNLRRLLAYSSIAHAGYMLIGLAVGLAATGTRGWDGIAALLFYLCVYAVATIGTFAALAYLGWRNHEINGIDELAGLGRTHPTLAAALAIFMFSLAGIPPLAGFWGKLTIFGSALCVDAGGETLSTVRVWFLILAVVGVLNAAVAAAYYLRIVAMMYFRLPLSAPKAQGGLGAWTTTMACAVLTVLIGLYSGPLLRASNSASPTATKAAPELLTIETATDDVEDPGRGRPGPRAAAPEVGRGYGIDGFSLLGLSRTTADPSLPQAWDGGYPLTLPHDAAP